MGASVETWLHCTVSHPVVLHLHGWCFKMKMIMHVWILHFDCITITLKNKNRSYCHNSVSKGYFLQIIIHALLLLSFFLYYSLIIILLTHYQTVHTALSSAKTLLITGTITLHQPPFIKTYITNPINSGDI